MKSSLQSSSQSVQPFKQEESQYCDILESYELILLYTPLCPSMTRSMLYSYSTVYKRPVLSVACSVIILNSSTAKG
jgi:hypothetical protein